MDAFDRLMSMGQSPERVRVVICRNWDNPAIKITVNKDSISLESDIGSFINALAEEMGSPALVLTREQLKKRMAEASLAVLEKIKQTSAQVM